MEQLIKEHLGDVANALASIIESKISKSLPTEEEIDNYLNIYGNMVYEVEMSNPDYKQYIKNLLVEKFQFKIEMGTLIYDEQCEPWFKDFKAKNDNMYFDRYKEYLRKYKGYNKNSLDVLDNDILDAIMDYLGNPNIQFNPRRGLVMGDVQSGKTSTYIGLICKAADAGYKAIIVLTGTVECLRQQTQKRLDEGFIGFDSDHMSKIQDNNIDYWVGVGRINHKRGVVLTSKNTDFVQSTAKNLGFSLENFKDTVLFVVKKNVSVLTKLLKWLTDLNATRGKIDYPLLVIDDEADNASINTNSDEENPTKINNLIRKLLGMFTKNNYVGFTATPFANVFINPNVIDDLFPKDFIYSLKAPAAYIGPQDMFLEHSKYKNSIVYNNDCEEVLPLNHKKYVEFTKLPFSLKSAMMAFYITNVIRDLKNETSSHRGMLINISRFNSPQEKILNVVDEFHNECLNCFKLYSKNIKFVGNNEIYKIAKHVFDAYYSSLNDNFTWEQVWNLIYDSNKTVETILVNSTSKMINYDDYKENGARLIVIGGLSLSRGLTIEGLCISYIYRSSQVYDVLLQMGRWFGFRNGYDDLFKVWMPAYMRNWYNEITVSVEELKDDLTRMQELHQKPSEFGIKIRSNTISLKITSRNKMLTSADYEYKKSIFGEFESTRAISSDLDINKANFNMVQNKLLELISCGYTYSKDFGNRYIFYGVPRKYIVDIMRNFNLGKAYAYFDKNGYSDFIDNYKGTELDLFDIGIVSIKDVQGTYDDRSINFAGIDVVKPSKSFDVIDEVIRFRKSRCQLVDPYEISYGLSEDQIKKAEEIQKNIVLSRNNGVMPEKINMSARSYLRIPRRPIFLIYLISLNLSEMSSDESEKDYNYWVDVKNKFSKNNVTPIAFAFGIPEYPNKTKEYINYKINMIEQQRKLTEEEFDDYDEGL